MVNKKRKFNARFPPARIKKIMQKDEDIGKIAAPVPVVISRALELFLDDILTKSVDIANKNQSKTLTPSHIKRVVETNEPFDFLKSLVRFAPELQCEVSDTGIVSFPKESKERKPRVTKSAAPTNSSAPTNSAALTTSTSDKPDESQASNGTSKPYKRKRGRPPLVGGGGPVKTEPIKPPSPMDQSDTNPEAVSTSQPELSSVKSENTSRTIYSTESSIFNQTSTVLHTKPTLSPAHTLNTALRQSEPYIPPKYTDLSPTSMPIDLTLSNSEGQPFSLSSAVSAIHNEDDYDV